MPIKSSGSLSFRDDICAEFGGIPTVFAVTSSPWSAFMNANAVWVGPASDTNVLIGQYMSINYMLTVTVAGTYTLYCQGDNRIQVVLDGRTLVTFTETATAFDQPTPFTVQAYLDVGTHRIVITGYNDPQVLGVPNDWANNPAGFALTVHNPSGTKIFSLRDQVGQPAPISLSQYYRGGGRVPDTAQNAAIATAGSLAFSMYYGASALVPTAPSIVSVTPATIYDEGTFTGGSPAIYDLGTFDNSRLPDKNWLLLVDPGAFGPITFTPGTGLVEVGLSIVDASATTCRITGYFNTVISASPANTRFNAYVNCTNSLNMTTQLRITGVWNNDYVGQGGGGG